MFPRDHQDAPLYSTRSCIPGKAFGPSPLEDSEVPCISALDNVNGSRRQSYTVPIGYITRADSTGGHALFIAPGKMVETCPTECQALGVARSDHRPKDSQPCTAPTGNFRGVLIRAATLENVNAFHDKPGFCANPSISSIEPSQHSNRKAHSTGTPIQATLTRWSTTIADVTGVFSDHLGGDRIAF